MDRNLDTYELDEIIDEAIAETDQEINEQFAGPQYQQYNPEQLSVMNLLKRAQQTPQGSSTLADILRGAYSLPGTDDEIAPIPPEHLTIKNVYLQSIMFALRTAILATSPPARVFTLARLMFNTPHPKTATELITTIAGIWGNAAKDIVDDAVIRAYRAVDYGINKVAIPIMAPFLTFFASGAMATAIEGRIGGSVLTVLENPQEVTRNTATKYDYASNVLMLKGQMGDDERFIGISMELIEYLAQYVEFYEQGLPAWNKAGISSSGEDFIQLLLSQWNDTIGSENDNLKISSVKNMLRLADRLRGELPLPDDLKQAMFDFFSGVKFDEGGGWTVIAGTAGAPAVPLPLVDGQAPVIATGDGLSTFTPNSFFDAGLWNQTFWKFWSDKQVAILWTSAVGENPQTFFENDDFLNKYIAAGPTVFSTSETLRGQLLKQAADYFNSKYEDEEARRKFEQFKGALEGKKVEPEAGLVEGDQDVADESGLTSLERKFVSGETKYEDFAKPVSGLDGAFKEIAGDVVLTPIVADVVKERGIQLGESTDFFKLLENGDLSTVFKFTKGLFDKHVMSELTTTSLVSRMAGDTNLEGDDAARFLNSKAIGTDDEGEFESVYKMSLMYYTALALQSQAASELKLDNEKVVSALSLLTKRKSLD